MNEKLKNKTALITGASRGIGKAIVESLSRYNMKLGLLARSEEQLKNIARYVNDTGSEALILSVDLNNINELEKIVCDFKQRFGTPDYLINNAGIGVRGFWPDLSLERELEITTVNYLAPITLIRHILPEMLRLGRGHIININTIGGVYAAPYQGAYCASKAALLAYATSLAYELENTKVNISSIFLGPTDTDFMKQPNFESFRKSKGVTTPGEVAKTVLSVMNHPKETGMVGSVLKLFIARITNLHPIFFRRLIESKNVPPKRITIDT